MAQNNGYRLCLLCLGEGHNGILRPPCRCLMAKGREGKAARLKAALWKKVLDAPEPTRENTGPF